MAAAKKSLKELLAENFNSIREDVNKEIKYKVALTLKISDRTIDRYLSGIIHNVTLGTSIYNALKREIRLAAKAIEQAG